jgi:Coenzyme PQQ synthesis protein D (PqqD)
MFRISDAVRSTSTQDGFILLDTRHGRIFGLNEVGSKVFDLLQRGFDQAQIADEISRDFGMSLAIVRQDVSDFLDRLGKHEILKPIRSDGELERPTEKPNS